MQLCDGERNSNIIRFIRHSWNKSLHLGIRYRELLRNCRSTNFLRCFQQRATIIRICGHGVSKVGKKRYIYISILTEVVFPRHSPTSVPYGTRLSSASTSEILSAVSFYVFAGQHVLSSTRAICNRSCVGKTRE